MTLYRVSGRWMYKLFCVAAGQEHTRKVANVINRRHLYLNYGLLGLATMLRRRGADAFQVQGNFDPPETTLKTCNELGLAESPLPLFVSIPSFYALSWAREFIRLAKTQDPWRSILVGGRWVAADRPDLLKASLGSGVDEVIAGLGEPHMDRLFQRYVRPHFPSARPLLDSPISTSQHEYHLLHNRQQYQPSIEIARGCGMGCSFCQERAEPLQPLKAPEILLAELQDACIRDEYGPMTPYFEASVFAPGAAWAERLTQVLRDSGTSLRWRTEARADSVTPARLAVLAKAGLSVLDVGLESASPAQLLRMRKTQDPHRYLARASDLLCTARDLGIRVKVNVLLFAGETVATLQETEEWLERHRDCIAGVSVGPVMVFGWQESTADYVRELEHLGARPARVTLDGVQELHLSSEIDHETAHQLSRQLSRRFMTADQYYALKSFSYFPRWYGVDDFRADIRNSGGDYSFSTADLSGRGSAAPRGHAFRPRDQKGTSMEVR